MENLKLLIIEDDADQSELIRETLEAHFGACTVACAGSLKEALSLDAAAFDLILCDYNLPDGNGLDMLDTVTRCCDTPIIMVTGENNGPTAAEAIRRGAMDYVVKVGEYLFTIPLVVQKNLTVAKIKRENERLRDQLENAAAELREKNEQLQESLRAYRNWRQPILSRGYTTAGISAICWTSFSRRRSATRRTCPAS